MCSIYQACSSNSIIYFIFFVYIYIYYTLHTCFFSYASVNCRSWLLSWLHILFNFGPQSSSKPFQTSSNISMINFSGFGLDGGRLLNASQTLTWSLQRKPTSLNPFFFVAQGCFLQTQCFVNEPSDCASSCSAGSCGSCCQNGWRACSNTEGRERANMSMWTVSVGSTLTSVFVRLMTWVNNLAVYSWLIHV